MLFIHESMSSSQPGLVLPYHQGIYAGYQDIFANFLMKFPSIIIKQIIVETGGWRLFYLVLHFFSLLH